MSDPEELVGAERSGDYAAVVGERLRAVRRQRQLSLQAVAASSGQEFRASALGAYERGERAISVPRLQRLAHLYGVPVEQLLPPTDPMPARPRPPATERGRGGAVTIDLEMLAEAPGEHVAALRRFVDSILRERHQVGGRTLTIRRDDLRVIGAAFGLGDEGMLASLKALGVAPLV
ncbi:MAG: helix-turn-helix domain-containing protein [Actinomycetota bacterium]|nr:helix-turn-helix domain-containing protein [Actinomycetota bacterium]